MEKDSYLNTAGPDMHPDGSRRLDLRPGTLPFETPDSLNVRAVRAAEEGRGEEAERLWRIALLKDPEHIDSRFNLSLFLLRHREGTSAEKILADLRKLEEGRPAGLAEAVIGELGTEPVPVTGDQFTIGFPNGQVCASLVTDGRLLTTVRQGDMFYASCHDAETGRLLWQNEKAHGVTGESFRTCVIRPDGKQCVSVFTDGTLLLYDMEQEKTVLVRSGLPIHKRGEEEKLCMAFSPDGSLLALGEPRYRDQRYCHTLLLEVPELRIVADVRMELACMTTDNTCVVRGREENRKNDALYEIDRNGESRVRFRFEKKPGMIREYQTLPAPFLCYTYEETGEHFLIGPDFQKQPLSEEIFRETEYAPFYDPDHGLLYTQARFGNLNLWDLATQRKRYGTRFQPDKWRDRKKAIPSEGESLFSTGLIGAEYDGNRWLAYLSRRGYASGSQMNDSRKWNWYRLALPASGERKPAAWRRAPAADGPVPDEEAGRAAALSSGIQESLGKNDTAGALAQWRIYREIPAAFWSAEYTRLEDAVNRAARRERLHSVRETGPLPEMPAYAVNPLRETACSGEDALLLCGTQAPDVFIRYFSRDGELRKQLPLSDAAFAAVRENRIFVFSADRDCMLFDREGKLLPLPWPDWPQEKMYFDLDPEGRRLLYLETRYGSGIRMKDLDTGAEQVVMEAGSGYDARDTHILPPRFLADGSFVYRHYTTLHVCGPDGRETASLQDKTFGCDYERDVLLTDPDRRFILYRTRPAGPKKENTWTVFDPALHTVSQWDDPIGRVRCAFIPGTGLIACAVQEILYIRNWMTGECLFETPADQITGVSVRPDGRELYAQDRDAVRSFRLSFDYAVREAR